MSIPDILISSTAAENNNNMEPRIFIATQLQHIELSFFNKVYFNPLDYNPKTTPYVKIVQRNGFIVFSGDIDDGVAVGHVAFSLPQRMWTKISLDDEVFINGFPASQKQHIVGMTLIVDHFKAPKDLASIPPLNTDEAAREFLMTFTTTAFTIDQELVFKFRQGDKEYNLSVEIKQITIVANDGRTNDKATYGMLLADAAIVFDKKLESSLSLIGKNKGKSVQHNLINQDWDFQKIGIGGLDKEFADIFRRAFVSRIYPKDLIEKLGIKHVRGILLFGPPGTGKTLIARQMGKMLNAREPKIVNGPELLNKYVGESEANMRNLFADAEEEYKRCGANSGLHMIIFDEIDAICKQRGSQAGSSGVHDTMVNQLLTKLDGVGQLNNILVIGMTNRKDLIDEALLRPGRMEVQLEISLPDENGRVQILEIHTERMQEFNYLANDVDLPEIARRTKNFSGAEIEGLVRAAQSSGMNRFIKVGSSVEIDHDAIDKLKITMDDFDYALEHDIKPAYGTDDDILDAFLRRGLISWNTETDEILKIGKLLARETTEPGNPGFTRGLFYGKPNTGKTYLVSRIAKDADFPFIKVITPQKMIGFTETEKCQSINKMFNDAYKSPFSILIIDELEHLMDYTPIGPRFSNLVLQALLILLNQQPPKGHKLLVLATSSCKQFLEEVKIFQLFNETIKVSQLHTAEEYGVVAEESGLFTDDELGLIRLQLGKIEKLPAMGIKMVLQFLDYARASDERPEAFIRKIKKYFK